MNIVREKAMLFEECSEKLMPNVILWLMGMIRIRLNIEKHMAELVLYKNVDMVIGDRLSSTYFEENKRPFHNFGNSLVRETINRLFHTNIRDIMTGYRAFSYPFCQKVFPGFVQRIRN